MANRPHSMTRALLIIDVQNALCFGAWAAHDSAGLIGRINTLAARFRAARRPVIFIQHESPQEPLQRDSTGCALAEGLQVTPSDHVVPKTATDSFHQTALHALLQQHGVSDLVVCGLQSEFCVDTTVRRALGLGYPVTLVADGHSTMDSRLLKAPQISAHHTETLSNITSFGPRVTPLPAAEVEV